MLAILGIGPLEWLVLLGGAVMLFGGDLPGMARKSARFLGRWRAMVRDLTRELDLHDTSPPPRPPAPHEEDDWEPDTGVDAESRLDQGEGAPGLPPAPADAVGEGEEIAPEPTPPGDDGPTERREDDPRPEAP